MRDIGNAGEARVVEWCSLAGITLNKASIDRHGWDFFFELSSGYDLSSAAGLHESGFEGKVQIKTTDSGVKNLSIELSNLHAMATTSLPSFYLMVDYDGGGAPKSARLLHVDNDNCEKILARVRAETTKNKKVKLNKKKMVIDFKGAIEVLPLDGEGLKAAIVSCVGPSQGDYVRNKQEFLRTVGYGDNKLKMNFNLNEKDIERFVEMSIGGSDRVKVEDVKGFATRFGISEEIPGLSGSTALMSMSAVSRDERGKVIFKNRKTGARSEWEVEVFQGALGDWVPEKLRRMRLRADRFSMDIGFDLRSFRFWFHKSDSHLSEIRELLKFYKLLRMLEEPQKVDLVLNIDGQDLRATLSGGGLHGSFDRAIKVITTIQKIQEHFDHYDDLMLTVSDLTSNEIKVRDFLQLIEADDDKVEASCKFTVKGLAHKSVDCIIPFPLVLGNICFVNMFAVGGDLSEVGINEYKLKVSWRKPIYRVYCKVSDLREGDIREEIERAARSYESSAMILDYSESFLGPIRDRCEDSSLNG
ncbi:TPA: hypothetical protein ACOJPK_000878 [Pseudomonas putida]|uniref:hypothetical protein n=1 Tax=Pseudomonas sp. TaxID=306 RepID=UPI000EAB98D5|nr:hypothetical protein [Pseudomonas sp.]MDN5520077.1 hypothetical protein [Pseudomonas sp.]MDN5531068.1 hypothetical protein [Pseudomonas sp.]